MAGLFKPSRVSDISSQHKIIRRTAWQLIVLLFIALVIIGVAIFVVVPAERGSILEDTLKLSSLSSQEQKRISQELDYRLGRSIESGFLAIISVVLVSSIFFILLILHSINKVMRRQRSFIASISHELKNPLAIIQTDIEVALLDESSLATEDYLELLRYNLEEVNHLSGIIDNMINVTYAKHLSMQPVNIGRTIQYALMQAERLADNKGVKLIFNDLTNGNLIIEANQVAIEQVIINLLKNAIFHSPYGEFVTIALSRTKKNKICISVSNYGEPISWWEKRKIFEPFYKSKSLPNNLSLGAGLGLTIVQEIVLHHAGYVMVNNDPGRGTTFSVFLPYPEK